MRFRPMAYDDLPQIMAIELASFTSPWDPEMFVAEMMGPVSYATVAEQQGCVVAYATYRVVIDEAHLMNIAVTPERKGEGLGRALMDRIMDRCRCLGAAYMFLEVRRSNVAAQALYNGLGFEYLDVRKGYYSDNHEDAIILKLDFPEDGL